MTSLINKIEQLIKREKTTPERKRNKDESTKSSSEILSELFGAFNADPPKIDESIVKKPKKSKKKHKKEKKKRSRSSSSDSDSDDSDYSHKRKKRKKSKDRRKEKKRKHSTKSPSLSPPPPVKPDPDLVKVVKQETKTIKTENVKIKEEKVKEEKVKVEPKVEGKRRVSIKYEEPTTPTRFSIDASNIPMPDSPSKNDLDSSDLRLKLDSKKSDSTDNDKNKGKIQIKNLKFSAVYEETVKKAEEEAKKKAKLYEEGEYTDSSSSSAIEVKSHSDFPKTSDPSGILKQYGDDDKMHEDESSRRSKHTSSKSSRRDKSRRSPSRSRRSRSRSTSRRHTSYKRRSRSRHRSSSRTRHRSRSRRRSRSRSRTRVPRPRHPSPRERPRRSPTGVRLADHEKKRLLEVARRNAINMLKNGAVPAGAAALPPHTRSQVMAAIQSGGKSVDELTDFCKHLSKKEALGELSSVSSHDEGSENEDTLAFHHPFLVKEKAPIVMNIRGGVPLPVKSAVLPVANKEELRLQFPVSSGSQHREKATEWRPVSPKKDNMEIAKLNTSHPKPSTSTKEITASASAISPDQTKSGPLALPAPPPPPAPLPAPPAPPPAPPAIDPPPYLKSFTGGTPLASVPDLPALPAPGPQAYPPGVEPPKTIDLAQIVSQKIAMIRKEQEQNEFSTRGFGWSRDRSSGLFTGSTGAQILTPRELAAGTQAWAKKDQLVRAAPVHGGMGMTLLQKMGWTPGQGLGKEGTGTLQPLLLEVKLDTKGLQAKEEVKNKAARNVRPGRRGPAPLVAGGKHPVSLLGEYCSKQKLGPPEYNLCFECGPDHKKNFLFRVKVAGVEYQPAVASINKKQAKADAANLALQKLGIVTGT